MNHTSPAMNSSESGSRPVYVYLLALTALLLFGVNFMTFLESDKHQIERHVVIHGDVYVPDQPRVVAPQPPTPFSRFPEIQEDLERARVEIERAKRQVEELKTRDRGISFVYVR